MGRKSKQQAASDEDENMANEEDEVVSEQDSIVSEQQSIEDQESGSGSERRRKSKGSRSQSEGRSNSEGEGKLDEDDDLRKSMRNDSRSQSSSCVQTRRARARADEDGGDADMRSQSSASTQKKGDGKDDKKHKKKKKKKDKKKKDKKKKDKKKKKKKKRGSSTDSDSSNSSDSSGEWKFDDKGVNYGSPEKISEGSSDWDGRSQELYDSDNPDQNLNLYHLHSKPRILVIEDYDQNGDHCQLELDCLKMPDEDELAKQKKKDASSKMTYQERKREQELNLMSVDHREYQGCHKHGQPKPLVLHNLISQDFVRGVAKNLTCPICQEMVTNPVIYKSCLHRFCNTCIESYNRLGKKECPLCRKQIGNRRQLRPDKNIQALMDTLKYDFIKLQKQEELENAEIRRKIIQEQKQLRDRKEKQKRVLTNELRRKFSETQEEKKDRIQKEREEQGLMSVKKKSKGSAGFGGTDGGVDTNHVIRMIEEKKLNLPNLLLPVDIEITITHDKEQNDQYKMMVKRIRLKAHRSITLIHLGILVAHKNLCKEDEWPNYEFYPGASFRDYIRSSGDQAQTNWKDNGRPFRFKMSVVDIIKELYPGQEDSLTHLDMIYKKKQMPNMNPKLTNIVKPPILNAVSPMSMGGDMNSMYNGGGSAYGGMGRPGFTGYQNYSSMNSSLNIGGGHPMMTSNDYQNSNY